MEHESSKNRSLDISSPIREEVTLLAAKFMEGDGLTVAQTDRVLEEQSRVNQYKRKDNEEAHIRSEGQRKSKERMFLFSLVFTSFLIGIVAWRTPEYLRETISAAVGFLGGIGFGKYSDFK